MHQHFADFPSFQSIRQNREGKKSDADTAKDLELTLNDYSKLKLLIERVQKLSLNRVDARACDMGKNDVLMSAVQVFLGSNVFCAPKIMDAFGNVPYHVPTKKADFEKSWKDFLKDNPDAVVEGTSPDRLALAFKDFSESGVRAKALAEFEKSVNRLDR